MNFSYFAIIISILLFGRTAVAQPSHEPFDQLLKEFVDEQGWVDYTGLGQKRDQLENYLDILRKDHPDKSWSRNNQISYWINAYNAFTLELVLDNYPTESIKDIGSWLQIPFVNTPWDIEFIEIKGKKYDLNNIEHDFLRGEFEEPRIHFAIVCASISCPKLSRSAYEAATLDQQLEAAAIDFINDKQRNEIAKTSVAVSKIFSWFGRDFKKQTTLVEFLNKYSETKIAQDARIRFLEYNWNLNDKATID